jgi:hypothetical protein
MMNKPPTSVARRGLAVLASAFLAFFVLAGPVAADSVVFGTPTAVATFGKGIDFTQPVGGSYAEANIVLSFPGDLGPSIVKIENAGSTLKYTVDTSTGGVQPNTKISAHFQVVFSDGSVQAGPDVSVTYVDDRFAWKTKTGTYVKLHWYEGSDSFAQQMLAMGEAGIDKSAKFLGVTETTPIDFFVYADQSPFYDALGPGTRENVGGQANSTIRTLFALVTPNELGYARSVVPHELTHIVFDDGTSNPYHSPPRWLNEGMAVYLADGLESGNKSLVSKAVKSGTLMPLPALTGQFPTTADRFRLAYAESVSAVEYLVRKYGTAPFKKLMTEYRSGASDDEAFVAAFGIDTAAVNKGWLAENGVTAPETFGPQLAPTGPIPPGWTTSGGAQGSPGATQPPAKATAAPSGAVSGGGSAGGSGNTGMIVAAILALAGVGLLLVATVVFARDRDGRRNL